MCNCVTLLYQRIKVKNYFFSSDLFVSVKYKNYKSSFPQRALSVRQAISDSDSSRPTPSSSSFEEDSDESVSQDMQIGKNIDGFDFGFNERRDAKLVAKNANKLMKNDKVSLNLVWFSHKMHYFLT